MNQELIYTSAPRGLATGSKGFCTVASTPGMAANLASLLESLSAYRHSFPPHSDKAKLNPVNFSFVTVSLGGTEYRILSRVADAGLDYSHRSNKLAQHIVVEQTERSQAGPAWVVGQPGVFVGRWEGEPRKLAGRGLPSGAASPGICSHWERVTGDAGWAGELAATFARGRTAFLVFEPGTDVLKLIQEAQLLLSPDDRWKCTFSTYCTSLPPQVRCLWRAVLADSPELAVARRTPDTLIINLANPRGKPSTHGLVALARTGESIVETSPPTLPASNRETIHSGEPSTSFDEMDYGLDIHSDELTLASGPPSLNRSRPAGKLPRPASSLTGRRAGNATNEHRNKRPWYLYSIIATLALALLVTSIFALQLFPIPFEKLSQIGEIKGSGTKPYEKNTSPLNDNQRKKSEENPPVEGLHLSPQQPVENTTDEINRANEDSLAGENQSPQAHDEQQDPVTPEPNPPDPDEFRQATPAEGGDGDETRLLNDNSPTPAETQPAPEPTTRHALVWKKNVPQPFKRWETGFGDDSAIEIARLPEDFGTSTEALKLDFVKRDGTSLTLIKSTSPTSWDIWANDQLIAQLHLEAGALSFEWVREKPAFDDGQELYQAVFELIYLSQIQFPDVVYKVFEPKKEPPLRMQEPYQIEIIGALETCDLKIKLAPSYEEDGEFCVTKTNAEREMIELRNLPLRLQFDLRQSLTAAHYCDDPANPPSIPIGKITLHVEWKEKEKTSVEIKGVFNSNLSETEKELTRLIEDRGKKKNKELESASREKAESEKDMEDRKRKIELLTHQIEQLSDDPQKIKSHILDVCNRAKNGAFIGTVTLVSRNESFVLVEFDEKNSTEGQNAHQDQDGNATDKAGESETENR